MDIFRDIIRRLLANPMAVFVYGILGKWYIMVMVASLVVTFWVFKGLEQVGVLSAAYNVVSQALEETKAVAKYCTPRIVNLRDFFQCVQDTDASKYNADDDENQLTNQLNSDNQNYQQRNQRNIRAYPNQSMRQSTGSQHNNDYQPGEQEGEQDYQQKQKSLLEDNPYQQRNQHNIQTSPNTSVQQPPNSQHNNGYQPGEQEGEQDYQQKQKSLLEDNSYG